MWWFVFGSLFIVAVVGLWPVKGYIVDEEIFYRSLLSEGNSAVGGKAMNTWNDTNSGEILTFHTGGEARETLEALVEHEALRSPSKHLSGIKADVVVLNDDDSDSLILAFQYRNVVGVLIYDIDVLPPGKNRVNEGGGTASLVIDGIDREIAGVTTFYNPPVRQLWIDQVRPILQEHFPKLVSFDSPFHANVP